MIIRTIRPSPRGLSEALWQGALEHSLLIQRCETCGSVYHPPVSLCKECHGFDLGWQEATGSGTIYSFTIVRHAVHPAVEQFLPYNIALIELTEGPRIVSTICDAEEDEIQIGREVVVDFVRVDDTLVLPVFRLA